jgi:hypothetical protein
VSLHTGGLLRVWHTPFVRHMTTENRTLSVLIPARLKFERLGEFS